MAEMRCLTHRETERLLAHMRAASWPGPNWMRRWGRWQREWGERLASVEFPLGELMNPRIAGFAWVWTTQDCIATGPIQTKDQFNAQGLPVDPPRGEEKARVRTTLSTGLLVYDPLPPYRCQVKVAFRDDRRNSYGRQGKTRAGHPAPVAPQPDLVAVV